MVLLRLSARYYELKRQRIRVNHKRVLRLMREENLLRRPKKRFVAATNSDHRLPVYPNLAAEMDITAPDQLWVSDTDVYPPGP